jgi:hypothetical protein
MCVWRVFLLRAEFARSILVSVRQPIPSTESKGLVSINFRLLLSSTLLPGSQIYSVPLGEGVETTSGRARDRADASAFPAIGSPPPGDGHQRRLPGTVDDDDDDDSPGPRRPSHPIPDGLHPFPDRTRVDDVHFLCERASTRRRRQHSDDSTTTNNTIRTWPFTLR